jgi:hypothetical protein
MVGIRPLKADLDMTRGRKMKLVRLSLLTALLLMLGGCTGSGPRAASPAPPSTPTSPSPVGSPLKHTYAAFAACPDISKTLPVGTTPNVAASAVAVKFVVAGPEAALQLSDPVAPANGLIAHLAGRATASVLGSRSARNDGLLVRACGRRVAARSWRVTVDDGTTSASLDTWVYLVRRPSGWKVWGRY